MKQVTVLALFKARPGLEEAVRNEILALVQPTRSEAGCLNYDLHVSGADPSSLMLYENWVSKEDLDQHLAMPYLQAFLAKADSLLAEPVQILLWDKIA